MISDVHIINNEPWVAASCLKLVDEIDYDYVKNAMKRFRDKKIVTWENIKHPQDRRKRLIRYNSIPLSTQIKLPSEDKLIENYHLQKQSQKEQSLYNNVKNIISGYYSLISEHLRDHVRYYPQILQEYPSLSDEKLLIESRRYAAIKGCISLLDSGVSLKYIYQAYQKVQTLDTSLKSYSREDKLKAKLDDVIYYGISGVLHKSTGKSRNSKKFNKTLERIFIIEYSKPSLPTIADVKIQLDAVCEEKGWDKVSISTLKSCYRKHRNRIDATRFGMDRFKKEQKGYVSRTKPMPGSKVVIDGTPLQFFYRDAHGKVKRLYIFVVFDVGSGKVVGFYFSDTETRVSVAKALQIAYTNTGYLPGEIVTDNSSAIKSKEITRLFKRFERQGVIIRHAKPGNAQDKEIEQFFRTFHKYCRSIAGWLGGNITNIDKNYRPDRKYISRVFAVNGYPNKDTLSAKIIELIDQYNCDEMNGRTSPARIHSESSKPHTIKISQIEAALIFWIDYEHEVKNSMIKRTVGGEKYEYSVYKHADVLSLNREKVLVKVDNDYLDEVHVFDIETEQFICTCKLKKKPNSAQVEQSEDDKLEIIKQAKHNEALFEEIKRMNYEDQKLLDESMGSEYYEPLDVFELRKEAVNNSEFSETQKYYGQLEVDLSRVDENFGKPVEMEKGFNRRENKYLTENIYDNVKGDLKPVEQDLNEE